MIKYLFGLLLFWTATHVTAQHHAVDSLDNVIAELPDDTTKVTQLNNLVGMLQFLDPAKAAARVKESIQLAKTLDYRLGLVTAYRLRGVLYVDRSMLDSGKMFYDKAFELVEGSNVRTLRRQAGLLMHNFGVIYHHKQKYDSATMKYLEARNIFKEINDEGLNFFPFTNLTTIYSFLKDNNRALIYAKEAYAAAVQLNDPGKVVVAINSEMSIRLQLKQYDSVLLPLQRNLITAGRLGSHYGLGKGYNLIAEYYGDGMKQYDSAIRYRKLALLQMEKINNQYEVAGIHQNLGYDYKQSGDYDNAFNYLKRATELARSLGLDQVVHYSVSNLVDVEERRGNIPSAFAYLKEYLAVNDSLQARNNRNQVFELEAKFQSEKKEYQIKELMAEKEVQQLTIRQKNIQNYVLIAGAIALLVISLLYYRYLRQRQKLQQHRIDILESEKQLSAAEAVLKGEEQERTRIAKDLHDGLGGMLSGIKYSFNTMKGNLIMTAENHLVFERSMDMLDSSIKEMRRVAHNMMPEALVKFGLDVALKDYCNSINQSGALQVSYQSFGLTDLGLDQITAISIYRIVQELVTNTIKHARAKTAIVQVSRTDNSLTITVEDDGEGFDTNILGQSRGIGWSNIQHRIDFLKGKLDVDSAPGKGTSVQIEFSV